MVMFHSYVNVYQAGYGFEGWKNDLSDVFEQKKKHGTKNRKDGSLQPMILTNVSGKLRPYCDLTGNHA